MLKSIRATILFFTLLSVITSCKKDKREAEVNDLVGDWRLTKEEYVPDVPTVGATFGYDQNSLQLRFFSSTRFSRYELQAQPALSAYDWFDGDFTIDNGSMTFKYDRANEKSVQSFFYNRVDATHLTLSKNIVATYGGPGKYTYYYLKVR